MDTTPLPGVAQITYPDGTNEFKYTDELRAALDRAEAVGYAPVVPAQPAQPITIQLVTPQPQPPAVSAERRPLVEPWMVRTGAIVGLTGGAAVVAPLAADAVGAVSAALGSLVHVALQVGGIGLAALLLVRLLTGSKKTGAGQRVEVIQTVTQTITNTVRIGE